MKPVCIIGAGWYGCHAGMCLKAWGIPFVIYEKNADIFTQASFYNQNRLHQGFHYARSSTTRKLCQEGYIRFMNTYKAFTVPVPNNIYLVSDKSLMDAGTYSLIMNDLGVAYEEVSLDTIDPPVRHATLALCVEEKYIDPRRARKFFKSNLGPYIRTGIAVDDAFIQTQKHDYSHVLNCTNNLYTPLPKCLYELTLSAIYKRNVPDGIIRGYTVVDGSFGSLYPYDPERDMYTLTHVTHTPLCKAPDLVTLSEFKPTQSEIQERVVKMEHHIASHLPSFATDYTYHSNFISYKCKPQSACDERGCYIGQTDNMITVVCGKITGIFQFEDFLHTIFQ